MTDTVADVGGDFIPWAQPSYWGSERELVLDALESTWISGGPYVDRLEAELQQQLVIDHVQAVSNGTSALHLAYLGLGLEQGAEIVLPAFGFQAAANVAILAGLRPVFCDVDEHTWCASARTVADAASDQTRAVAVIHTYGNMCPMDEIAELASRRGFPVIEDAAEAFGSRLGNAHAGTLGTIGTFSFHATKTITTGEGGAVATNDGRIAERMALYRSHGLRRKTHYWHEVPGHNFRLSNIQAALGCAQLAHLDRILAERARVYDAYRECLTSDALTLQTFPAGVTAVVWSVGARLSEDAYPQGRDAVLHRMLELGIECRPGFYTPHQLGWYGALLLPAAERLAASVITLPSFPALSEEQIDRICRALFSMRR